MDVIDIYHILEAAPYNNSSARAEMEQFVDRIFHIMPRQKTANSRFSAQTDWSSATLQIH